MSKKKILLIEDEEDIKTLISYNLKLKGYEVICHSTGEAGLDAVKHSRPDLVLLDLMLPGIGGLKICKELKSNSEWSSIPIIMVSAKGESDDIVLGLELGADDYITKPFEPRILTARVASVLRRYRMEKAVGEGDISVHDLVIKPSKFEAVLKQQKLELTHFEFKVLHFLAGKPGWVFTRRQLIDHIQGEDTSVTERTIDVLIVGLRKKLGEDSNYIETVRGIGYRFKEQA